VAERAPERTALRDLHDARRAHRVAGRDWIDGSYEVWWRAAFALLLIFGVPALLGGDALTAGAVDRFRDDAPAVLSLVLAIMLWVALASGARGAPLAPESADVMHLLLAPIPRVWVLRPLALRQWRAALTVGVLLGATTGSAAAGRLPAGPGAWIVFDALAGALVASLVWGTVALASARRLTARRASAIGFPLVVWAGVDAVAHTWSAPTSWVVSVAFLPLHNLVPYAAVAAGIAVAIVVPVLALASIGGTALEPLVGRSALVSQLQFASKSQDARTVVLLHRELAMDQPRRRPWARLPVRAHVRRPAWRRGWHGYLRWPARRIVRVVVLSAAAVGVALLARSTPLLLAVGGIALFVAALDVLEPFAAEIDHPTALFTYGVPARLLLARNLAAPIAALLAIGLVAAGVSIAIAPGSVAIACAVAISAPLAALGGSSLNIALGPPTVEQQVQAAFAPEIFGTLMLLRQALPPALAIAGLAPIVVAASGNENAAGVALVVAIGAALLATGALSFSCRRAAR
jgi:hypothetical protein